MMRTSRVVLIFYISTSQLPLTTYNTDGHRRRCVQHIRRYTEVPIVNLCSTHSDPTSTEVPIINLRSTHSDLASTEVPIVNLRSTHSDPASTEVPIVNLRSTHSDLASTEVPIDDSHLSHSNSSDLYSKKMSFFSDLTSMASHTIPIRIGGDDPRHAFTCNLYLQLIESRSRSFGDELRTLLETSYPTISLYDASLILEEFYLKLCNVPTDLITAIESCQKIGKIRVSDTEIGVGSNGTIAVEGFYDFVPVAVKRILKSHYDVALKEKEHLRVSDNHANIVRLYDVEEDRNFVYIALERCNCSLHDLILGRDQSNPSLNMEVFKDFELRKPYGGFPSPELLKVMRETVTGLGHLHEHGIIHRDVKPHNVLLLKDSSSSIIAKVSDMGISKRLPADTSFLTKSATGDGTFGWQAPEQLLRKEGQTRAVDMFSFGCLLFFCITGGKHLYGTDMLERCKNIVDDVKYLSSISHIPEAFHLISDLLDPNPKLRPTAPQVPHHPLLWDPDMRLSFLTNASDRIQLETRGSNLLKTLEANRKDVTRGKWATNLHHHGIPISEFKPYEIHDVSVYGLLRFIRNKRSHYVELSENVQNVLGSIPEEYESYFTSRFPKLFMRVYRVLQIHCREERIFCKYYKYYTEA